jgi:nitroreductase
MTKIIDNLNWRSAVKIYDTSRPVSDNDINTLKQAVRLAPSAFGMQPYKIFFIKTAELRKRLFDVSWGQRAVREAPVFVVVASYNSVTQSDIDTYFDILMEIRKRTPEQEAGYKQMVSGIILGMDLETQRQWTGRQAYVALAIMAAAAADLRIDMTPMEGFDAEKYNDILDLENQNLNAVAIAALGYRSPDDYWSPLPKVRKMPESLFQDL